MREPERIIQAYKRMASEAKYRPQAPGDGFGGIYLDADELADSSLLQKEASEYARDFIEQENDLRFRIGISCFNTVRAFVYTIEAARCLCAGHDFEPVAGKLLRMALAEFRMATSKGAA